MAVTIRAGRPDDGPALQTIELQAGERFREVGLSDVADHPPASVEELAAYANSGRSWVAIDDDDVPVGYVVVDIIDGQAHIEQISVRPAHQGAGVGRALIDRVRAWALESGRSTITLTTFTDVPWNRPLYEHLGWRVLGGDEIGPELAALVRAEASHGLDPTTRVCMALHLTPPGGCTTNAPSAG